MNAWWCKVLLYAKKLNQLSNPICEGSKNQGKNSNQKRSFYYASNGFVSRPSDLKAITKFLFCIYLTNFIVHFNRSWSHNGQGWGQEVQLRLKRWNAI
jgi:hypothetical protein